MAVAAYERFPVPPGAIEHSWRRDIETGVAAMTTTGGHLWNAAERLADYLEAEASCIGLDRPGVNILELGSGVGWLGMCLAANLHQAQSVTCTEQASGGAVAWLQQNVIRNSHLNLSRLRCCACDWAWFTSEDHIPNSPQQIEDARPRPETVSPTTTCPDRPFSRAHETHVSSISGALAEDDPIDPSYRGRWDFIVGSDLVYNEDGCQLLPRVFAQLSTPETVILYAHTKRRFEMLDSDFFQNLELEGLVVEEVRERWAPATPPSPPAFASLFPDMRIAVFRIMQRESDEC